MKASANNTKNARRDGNGGSRDSELLREYVGKGSEEAFRQIVERYVSLVYAVCRRRLRDTSLAEQATIETFTLFSRRAKTCTRWLPFHRRPLAAFLYKTAVDVSREGVREETRVPMENKDKAGVADLIFGESA